MVKKTVTVTNEQGLHMRPAGVLAKAVKDHPDCEVILYANGKTIKAKAPMQIMAAGMKKGCEVEIVCEGADEQAVLDEIAGMFEAGFGE
ncbi:HPr family phosphocarrier protein [Ruminococcus sp. Marseille-P6503]|uniref:HPr family phosphocarrier protein n=1 Tax=Ruminococcus sp. Marseille-P6503 TaxID=2364796 RepID=UPI000F53B180|nr:HPr family phosphocarrier protein [Ruminococcus sp. Marseille-P6503]